MNNNTNNSDRKSLSQQYREQIEELNKKYCNINGIPYNGTKWDSIQTCNEAIILRFAIMTDLEGIPYEGLQGIVDTF